MSKKRIKQYLMLLTVVGLVAIAAGGGNGTFASFNAQVTNPGNTFASGTLFLQNHSGTTTCNSNSGSLNTIPGTGAGGTDVCATLFNNVDLGGGTTTAHLELENTGTITGSDVKWDVSGCSIGDNSAVTGTSQVFGSLACSDMYVTIQETDNTYLPAGDVACAAGTTTTPPACDAPDGTYSLASSTPTNLLTTGAAAATFAQNTPRYYVITIAPTVANDNILQNRTVSFALDWNLEQ